MVPELLHHGFVKLKVDLSVFNRKNLNAELFAADHEIVGHCIPSKERLAVIGGTGQTVGPVVVCLSRSHKPFHCRQVRRIRAGCPCKPLPIGLVEHQNLGGFRSWENFQLVSAEPPLFKIARHIGRNFLPGQILLDIRRKSHPVNLIGCVRIGRKHLRNIRRAHLFVCRIQHFA